MSWFSLNKAMGTNYTVDPGDIVSTKTALNQLGYYDVPPHRGIDDWTDDAMFNGIKAFQKDNGLKVDGLMRPGGPTEQAINTGLAENAKDNTPDASGGQNHSRNNLLRLMIPMDNTLCGNGRSSGSMSKNTERRKSAGEPIPRHRPAAFAGEHARALRSEKIIGGLPPLGGSHLLA
ncbi:MAG: peptidoglycan-binding protein [Magnetospirillum sp.]|nr:peptidoglycan-binding protein [Magnetospirillum sp.]